MVGAVLGNWSGWVQKGQSPRAWQAGAWKNGPNINSMGDTSPWRIAFKKQKQKAIATPLCHTTPSSKPSEEHEKEALPNMRAHRHTHTHNLCRHAILCHRRASCTHYIQIHTHRKWIKMQMNQSNRPWNATHVTRKRTNQPQNSALKQLLFRAEF